MAKSCNVNQDACIGCGLCLSFADSVFAFNGDGKVENVLGGAVPADVEAAVEEAAANCPVAAIEVE